MILLCVLLIIQYALTFWVMITCLEGIFTKFCNAGIEGNLAILVLYIIAMVGNSLVVDIIGKLSYLQHGGSTE